MKLVRGLVLPLLALIAAVSAAVPAAAQSDGLGSSYLPPFPENDTYRLQVVGELAR